MGDDLSDYHRHARTLGSIAKIIDLVLVFVYKTNELTILAYRDGDQVGSVILEDETSHTGSLMWETSKTNPLIIKTDHKELKLRWVGVDASNNRRKGIGTLLMWVAYTLSLRLRRGIRYHWERQDDVDGQPIKFGQVPSGGAAAFHDAVLKGFRLPVRDVRFPGQNRSIHWGGGGQWARAYIPYELLKEREGLFEQYVPHTARVV
jgi:hypothetical protein